MRGVRRLLVLGAVLGLVLTACGGPAEVADSDDAGAPSEAPPPEPAPDEVDPADQSAPDDEVPADEPADETEPTEVAVFFVRSDDSGIWVEPEAHRLAEPTEAVARAALEILFHGTPYDEGLTSMAPADVELLATNIRDRVLIVDVAGTIEGHGAGSAQELGFAQQLAHTGAAFPTVDAVQLWVDGAPIDELWGHLDWSAPIEPDPFALAPITITEPAAGPDEPVVPAGEVVVRGEATVFEATFGIRILAADGSLVEDGFVTASAGAPERGTWSHAVSLLEPGVYTVEVEEDDPSDGEGRPPFVSSRRFEVR